MSNLLTIDYLNGRNQNLIDDIKKIEKIEEIEEILSDFPDGHLGAAANGIPCPQPPFFSAIRYQES